MTTNYNRENTQNKIQELFEAKIKYKVANKNLLSIADDNQYVGPTQRDLIDDYSKLNIIKNIIKQLQGELDILWNAPFNYDKDGYNDSYKED